MPSSGYRSIAYYVNWAIYARDHQPQDIPSEKLTHVLYAFANIDPETGNVFLTDQWSDLEKHYPTDSWNDTGNNAYGCIKQLYLHKKRNRTLKTLLSIGGWTHSPNFARPASTEQGRRRLAQSAVGLLKDLGFDGLDLDWEYPKSDAEADDFVRLLAAIRRELDRYASSQSPRPRFLLSVASPAGPSNCRWLRLGQMDRYLDFWNVMAYDFCGSWEARAGHQANVFPSIKTPAATPFSVHGAVEYYVQHGIAPAKLVIGMPLYGRAFAQTRGPGDTYTGTGPGSWENGVWDSKALPRGIIYHDEQAIASWCLDSDNTMVSYDTPSVAAMKAQYIKQHSLGGAMWWETSGDLPVTNTDSLIRVVVDGLGGRDASRLERSRNVLDYPQSAYDNVRNGMPGE